MDVILNNCCDAANPKLNSNTSSTIIHPVADRPLTVREMARVQGVPDRVVFQGSIADCYRQVGCKAGG